MADDNQGSRTFLAIVLGGIVLALVIAAFFMYGHKGDTRGQGRAADDRDSRPRRPAAEPRWHPQTPAAEPPAPETARRRGSGRTSGRADAPARDAGPRDAAAIARSGSEPHVGCAPAHSPQGRRLFARREPDTR